MKKKILKKTLFWFSVIGVLVIGFVFWSEPSMAQSPPGLLDDPEQTPIDGGLGILAALGGAYAIKKLRNKNDV